MSLRRLALVCGLTLADYLLWNWSTGGNHDVLAIVSGVTLPFLILASAILLVLNLVRGVSAALGRSRPPIAPLQPGSAEGREYRARRTTAAAGTARGTGRAASSPGRAASSRASPDRSSDPAPSPVPSGSPSPASTARRRAA